MRRDTARSGDELWILGEIGMARAGLELLTRNAKLKTRAARRALNAWRRPQALVREGRDLVGRARACMDLSDGLGRDAGSLAEASGVRVELDAVELERALSPELVSVARSLGVSALALAIEGGEDYALLASGPAKRRPAEAKVVGTVRMGSGAWLRRDDQCLPLAGGFDHFAR